MRVILGTDIGYVLMGKWNIYYTVEFKKNIVPLDFKF